ncbi:MAG: DUF3368 domain-containing protein [Chloroflexota bacterium]
MIIIADSSALIALAYCQGLDLLTKLYNDIKVPRAVFNEVTETGKIFSDTLAKFLEGRVEIIDIDNWVLAVSDLGRGEIEAMALYKQISADTLLIDDRRARLIAEYNDIHCIGTLGLLLIAKQKGEIQSVTPYLNNLRNSPVYFTEPLLEKVSKLANE